MSSVGPRLSRQLEPDSWAAEGWVHPSFAGPTLQLPADLRSKNLGGLPGGGVSCPPGVSGGVWLTKKPGTGGTSWPFWVAGGRRKPF